MSLLRRGKSAREGPRSAPRQVQKGGGGLRRPGDESSEIGPPQKRASKEQQEGNGKFQSIFDNSKDCYVYLSRMGKILEVNRKTVQVFGGSREELIGKHFTRIGIFSTKDTLLLMGNFRKILSGKKPFVDTQITNKVGQEVYLECSASLVKVGKKVMGIMVLAKDVTDQRKAEEALRRSEKEYRDLVDNALAGVFKTNLGGGILYANEALSKMLGYDSPEELTSESVLALYKDPKRRKILIQNLKKKSKVSDFEIDAFTKIGDTKTLLLSATLDGYTISGMAMDITGLKEVERALMESEERYSALVENTTDGIIIIQDGVLKFVNSASIDFVGSTPDEMIGTDFLDYVAPESRKIVMKRYADRIAGKRVPPIYEIKLLKRDGSLLPVEVNAELIEYEGKPADLVVVRNVTERKLFEEELKQSEEKFRSIVESAPDGIVTMNPKGKVTSCNKAFAKLTGYLKKEVVGKHFSKVPFLRWRGMPKYVKMFASMEGGRVPKPFKVTWMHKDGTERSAEIRVSRMKEGTKFSGFQAIARDITERKRAEEAIRESEERYRLLAENVGDVIWTTDLVGRFTYTTPSIRNLLGYTADETIGTTWKEHMTPASSEVLLKALENELGQEGPKPTGATGSVTLELELVREDGTTVWTETEATFLHDEDKGLTGILGVSRDITEHKKMIRDLERANEELRSAQAHLIQSEKLASIGTLASGIAHEINNPLAAITGYAEAILDEQDYPVVKDYASKIVSAAGRASDVVRWLSKHSRQAKDVNIVDLHLNEVLRDSLEAMKLTRSSSNIEVLTDYEEVPSIQGNRNELQQIFVNLLNNSADAMPGGGSIALSTKDKDGMVEVAISDTGMGIPKEYMNKIFDPFFTTKEAGEGTGLGLYVVSMIVNKHHGTVNVDSQVGKGTTFVLRFPTPSHSSEQENDKKMMKK